MAAQAFLPSGLMAMSNGWSPMAALKVTASVALSIMVIWLPAESSAMVVPWAVSILGAEGTLRILAVKVSLCASIRLTVLAVELETSARFFSPLGLGWLELLLEPQPAMANDKMVIQNRKR